MARAPLIRPLHDWLLVTHLLVFALPLIVVVATGALARDLRRQTVEDISHQAVLVALHVESSVASHGGPPDQAFRELSPALSDLLETVKERTLAGFRVVDRTGVVVAASNHAVGESLGEAPEVVETLRTAENEWWETERIPARSGPLSSPSRRAPVRMFVAEPIVVEGQVLGAVVVSRTPREELQAFWHMAPRLAAGAFSALVLVVGLAVLAGRVLSGSLRSLLVASHRMAAGDLDAIGDLTRARDSRVAETRDLAGAMGIMAMRLQARLRYIGEFASHVSHEFKTPVSSLRGAVELLLDDDEMPAAVRDRFLRNALDDLDRLTRMVTGLLQLARAEEGGDRRVLELAEVVDEVVQRHPSVQIAGVGGRVDGNLDQLVTAVHNLVENALRYGGSDSRVIVRSWETELETGVEVEDNGPGISAANLPQVFDRFFTTGREQGGTGLGLALVRAVVQAHGGRVTVTSRPGKTVFRVALPKPVSGAG